MTQGRDEPREESAPGADAPGARAVGVAEAPEFEVDDETEAGRAPYDEDSDDETGDDEAVADWAWVEEWRRSDEPPAWAPGIAIAVFTMIVVGCAVLVLSLGLGDTPWLAVAANVVVAVGLAPALWLCRSLPVLRFVAGGAAAGVLLGWIAALLS